MLLGRAVRAAPSPEVTVIGNTADDVALRGLRFRPGLGSVMYTVGGGPIATKHDGVPTSTTP